MNEISINCLVIGSGVSGLSIARKLAKDIPGIVLVDRNSSIAQETSSRNSEVIHAGIYYQPTSLKSNLCVEGKYLLYEYLDSRSIQYNRCGKYIVSTNSNEENRLAGLIENAQNSGVEDLKIFEKELAEYPFIKTKQYIYSPSSGIFDSHAFLFSLKNEFEDNEGILLHNNRVVKIDHSSDSYEVTIEDIKNQETFLIRTKLLINCAGLSSVQLANEIHQFKKYTRKFIKGEYYNYLGKEKLRHLIYPLPELNSVGLHATIDLGEGIRFGPSAYEVDSIDYSFNEEKKTTFVNKVKTYWPGIDVSKLSQAYTGIRPALQNSDDFIIDHNQLGEALAISILGYASPGLTSSLALANKVRKEIKESHLSI